MSFFLRQFTPVALFSCLLLLQASPSTAEDALLIDGVEKTDREILIDWLNGDYPASLENDSSDKRGTAVPLCNGGVFKPCICSFAVPETVSYNPSDLRCGRSTYPGDRKNYNASITLRSSLARSFSVVVRTFDNADRSPYEPSRCSLKEFQDGLNRCSRWKTQRSFPLNPDETLACLGASGYSTVFQKIRRITVKVSDRENDKGEKDIRRYCLKSPKEQLN